MIQDDLIQRITFNPHIFGGKPIIRNRRLAVEHILAMLATGDSAETILEGYPWLEHDDILACLLYAQRGILENSELMDSYVDQCLGKDTKYNGINYVIKN